MLSFVGAIALGGLLVAQSFAQDNFVCTGTNAQASYNTTITYLVSNCRENKSMRCSRA